MLHFFVQNQDTTVIIGGPGPRPPVAKLFHLEIKSDPILFGQKTASCRVSSIANAIFIICGVKESNSALDKLKEENKRGIHIVEFSRCIGQLRRGLQMNKKEISFFRFYKHDSVGTENALLLMLG